MLTLVLELQIAAARREVDRLKALVRPLQSERDRLPGLLDAVAARWVPATWAGPAAERGHAELVVQQENVGRAVAEVDAALADLHARIEAEAAQLGGLEAELARVRAREAAQARDEALAANRRAAEAGADAGRETQPCPQVHPMGFPVVCGTD